MEKFHVQMTVQTDGSTETDLEISKTVLAVDEREALDKARTLVRLENPEINAAKIWAWSIERR
ncbi:MAG: hypothetical protein H0W24_10565 [Lysobacter sp.]|jgi:hypothetical protein|nr:hypothetical protein [Lysobacter sp.]